VEGLATRHASGEAERFYRQLPGPAVIGMESTGNCQWFVEMATTAGHEVWIGDAAKIRASEVRQQKNDRRDAALILKLLLEGRFPRIWTPSGEEKDRHPPPENSVLGVVELGVLFGRVPHQPTRLKGAGKDSSPMVRLVLSNGFLGACVHRSGAFGPSTNFPTTERIVSITIKSAESMAAIASAGTHLVVQGTNKTNGT
jgi:hypothetical protein